MEITLRKNSWHTRLFLWTYDAYTLPDSLCNYFWALIFAIASIPLTIWSLPQTWMKIEPGNYLVRLAQSLLTLMLLGILVLLGMAFFKEPVKFLKGLGFFICFAGSIITLVFAYFGVKDTGASIAKTDTYKIVTGQVGSVKKKICPHIKWKP